MPGHPLNNQRLKPDMPRRTRPPEWPKNLDQAWVKFADPRAVPQGHKPREDGGAFLLWFFVFWKDEMPAFRIEDGWYWHYDWFGVPWKNIAPEIEWIELLD